jgi:hypothetical protein
MEHHTDENTDSSCLSMYSRGEGISSPPPSIVHRTLHQWKYWRFVFVGEFQRRRELFASPNTIHLTSHRWKYRWFVSVSVLQRWRELFPSLWHWSWNITSMEIPTVHVRWCIPEKKGVVPPWQYSLCIALMERPMVCSPSVYFRGKENCSPSHVGDGN